MLHASCNIGIQLHYDFNKTAAATGSGLLVAQCNAGSKQRRAINKHEPAYNTCLQGLLLYTAHVHMLSSSPCKQHT